MFAWENIPFPFVNKGNSTQGDQFSSAPHNDRGGAAHSDNSSYAFNTQPMGSGGGNALLTAQTVTGTTFHVGTERRVALQTAQAVVKGADGNLRVRVLFDAGSQRSSITSKAVRSAGLQVKRQEWIEVCTFGEQTKESGLKGVYDLQVFPIQGGGWGQNRSV